MRGGENTATRSVAPPEQPPHAVEGDSPRVAVEGDSPALAGPSLGQSLWLTRREACAYLRIGKEALRVRMRRGRIAYRVDGGRVFFARAELERYVAGQMRGRR